VASQVNGDLIHEAATFFVENNSMAVLIFDAQHHLVMYNESAKKRLRLKDELVGCHASDLPQGDVISQWLSKPGQHDDWSPESGAFFIPVVRTFGDQNALLLTLKDVSETRKLMRNQNEFIRLLSHDLRTPLTYILGFASMLEQPGPNSLNEKQRHFVSKIMTGIEQITRIVDNIQDAGRFDPETGFYEMNRVPADIGDIVRRVVEHVVVPIAKPELQLELRIDDPLPMISADHNMIERAVTNLVDNAIKYTPDGGFVMISVFRTETHMMIQVSDTGLGIKPEDVEKLFQRHVRIQRPEFNKIKGSGLGLFIVRSVAQHHDGSAWVESIPGEGSRFILSLPLRKS
jgi:signal transduction histidine kinase